tara:strand:+ start:2078 stop:2479 length:402 start_codon:yes stop_codon:yes gene_type:complete
MSRVWVTGPRWRQIVELREEEDYAIGSGKKPGVQFSVTPDENNSDYLYIGWGEDFVEQASLPVSDEVFPSGPGEAETLPHDEAPLPSPDFEAMTKEEIEQWALNNHDYNMNTRMTKVQMIARAEELFNAATPA